MMTEQEAREALIRVESIVRQNEKGIEKINETLERAYVSKAEFNSVKEDVNNLNDNVKWIVRLVLGSVIMALIGLVIVIK